MPIDTPTLVSANAGVAMAAPAARASATTRFICSPRNEPAKLTHAQHAAATPQRSRSGTFTRLYVRAAGSVVRRIHDARLAVRRDAPALERAVGREETALVAEVDLAGRVLASQHQAHRQALQQFAVLGRDA